MHGVSADYDAALHANALASSGDRLRELPSTDPCDEETHVVRALESIHRCKTNLWGPVADGAEQTLFVPSPSRRPSSLKRNTPTL